MIFLPELMVAPNGARLGKPDHPEIPVTIPEIVKTAIACKDAGCDGLHAHVRDKDAQHVLDAGLYRELLGECDLKLPDFFVQITSEAGGRYSPDIQIQMVRDVAPKFVSVALRELDTPDNHAKCIEFYQWAATAGVQIQHILYDTKDLNRLIELIEIDAIAHDTQLTPLQILIVLGRYTTGQMAEASMLEPFVSLTKQHKEDTLKNLDWSVCAFGAGETECLMAAIRAGGKVRVGFENNLINRDGSIAKDNAERVSEIAMFLAEEKLAE